MKRAISFVLTLALILCMAPSAFAAENEALTAADALHELGLFNGIGTDENGDPIYALDGVPKREQAVTMLVRLLGKEEEALAGTWETPFTDLAEWSKPYVGYAYANDLTSGTSATTFSGSSPVTPAQYITFVLRALGYDSSTDFQWSKAWELSDTIGLTDGRYNADSTNFLRGDIAIISNNALAVTLKDSESTLFEVLNRQGFGTVKETDTVVNGSGNPQYVLMNGKYYEFINPFWGSWNYKDFREVEYGGEVCQYVVVPNLHHVLSLLTNTYTIESSSNPFLAGKLDMHKKAEYSSNADNTHYYYDYGDFVYEFFYKYSNISTQEHWNVYRYRGNSCTLPYVYPDDYPTGGKLFFEDGIRCFIDNGSTYANLQDVLERLGFDATVTISEVEDVGCVLSFELH